MTNDKSIQLWNDLTETQSQEVNGGGHYGCYYKKEYHKKDYCCYYYKKDYCYYPKKKHYC